MALLSSGGFMLFYASLQTQGAIEKRATFLGLGVYFALRSIAHAMRENAEKITNASCTTDATVKREPQP